MLKLCSDDHDEICYEAAFAKEKCPVCKLIADHQTEKDDYESSIASFKEEVESLKTDLLERGERE